MFKFKNSLLLRIALPITILVIALWTMLYLLVLVPVSNCAMGSIEHDLKVLSNRFDNILKKHVSHLLIPGFADKANALSFEKKISLQQIKEFFQDENLDGLIYNTKNKKIIFRTDLPVKPGKIMDLYSNLKSFQPVKHKNDIFYTYFSDFKPLDWRIIIVRHSDEYSKLIEEIQRVYLYVLGSLILVAILLIFFIYKSISRPVKMIIDTINNRQKPSYKGIDVFEFLSETISDMMESIHQKNKKYRILVESSDHIVWEIDLYNRFTYISQTVSNIFGYIPDEVIGNTPFDFIPQEKIEPLQEYYRERSSKKLKIEELINPYITKQGNTVILETNAVPFFNKDGDLSGYRGISRDITERVEAEQEKINAQKTAAEQAKHALLGKVAGKIAHDFNNILGIIMGNTELAMLDCNDEKILKTLKLTLDQTLRGKNLTKNLVVFAKDQELKQEYFQLNRKISLIIDLLKKDLEGIKISFHKGKSLPELLADPGLIENALINLIQNSIHAVSKTQSPEITIQTYLKDNNIYCEIEDNGCGIPDKYLEKIYDPSFTLKGDKDITGSYDTGIKGTGYGMINVKKCIKQHNGKISVKSSIDHGTIFTICFPVQKNKLQWENTETNTKNRALFQKNILIVEDEETISEVLTQILILPPCNHKVDTAVSAESALDLFMENKYDLISLDYMLAGSLTGLDFYYAVREIDKTIPVLFVSGNIEFIESLKDIKKTDDFMANISKPFQNRDYVKAINQLL